jgi:glucokinase
MNSDIVAVDVGGTTIKGARYRRTGEILSSDSVPTPRDETAIVAAIVALCRSLRGPDTVAVGVVVPGVVDADAGIARWAANLSWRELPLRDLLAAELELPVVLEHDVSAAALAESAGGAEDLLFVALGTGIAGGHVIRGDLWRGASGTAGEIGHITVDPNGEQCACGRRGCLEVYASAAGIGRRYVAAGGTEGSSAKDIAARLGSDRLAARIWQEAVDALGIALATDVQIVDPAAIVLGGGLADAGELLLEPVRKALAARLQWRPAPAVRAATFGSEAGRRGAAELAWRLVSAEVQEGSAT